MDFHDQMDVGNVVRSIFSTCDVENTDLVPVSKLIEFIRPYLLEDLNALENLQHLLDPFNTQALVSSEKFYQVMNNWCQKFTSSTCSEEQSSDTEFNKTPGKPTNIDINDLPYTHSTPRASIGDKLLKCKDLLNLSNVSGYSLSSSRLEQFEPDKTILEEEIKMLKRQLAKTTSELAMIKQQLASSEDTNEQLQQDLDRMNKILQEEQQVNEHLNKDIKYSEDLRDELAYCKKHIGQLKSKLEQSEKDNLYNQNLASQLEQEKSKFEKKAETVSKYHQQLLKELMTARTEMEDQEEQMHAQSKVFNDWKQKFAEQKDIVDQLIEENNRLKHEKLTLEKALKSKTSNSAYSNFDDMGNGNSSEESFSWENQQEIVKTNGDVLNKTSKSLYAEICKTSPLPAITQSPLLLETDEVELIERSLLQAENLRLQLEGAQAELKKAQIALAMKSDEVHKLEKDVTEVKSKLVDSQTLSQNYDDTLRIVLRDLNDVLISSVADVSLQAQVTELQTDLETNDSKFSFSGQLTFKRLTLIRKQFSVLKRVNDTLVGQNARLQEEVTLAKQELEQQKQSLNVSVSTSCRSATDIGKGKTYSKQQIVIAKLKEKNEHLENLLKTVPQSDHTSVQSKFEDLKMIEHKIAEKQNACEDLEMYYRQLTEDVRTADEKLKLTQAKLNCLKRRPEEDEADLESGALVDDVGEKRTINKFTLSGSSEDQNCAFLNGELSGLNELRLSTKSFYSRNSDTALDVVPTLDVKVFADDLIDELDWIESSPRSREKLGRDELEKMVTALTLQLIAQASTTTQRIEKETEKYRSQYERLLNLIADISHRLRDHVCIGTSEPIIPVHVLLEEVKQHIKMLVQNTAQVSVLISEHRIKWCLDLLINYMAILQKDNEALRNSSRLVSSSSQTDLNKRLNVSTTQVVSQSPVNTKKKRSCFGYPLRAMGLFVAITVVIMALIIAINLTCRMIASDSQYCPFDGAVERINIGLPPI